MPSMHLIFVVCTCFTLSFGSYVQVESDRYSFEPKADMQPFTTLEIDSPAQQVLEHPSLGSNGGFFVVSQTALYAFVSPNLIRVHLAGATVEKGTKLAVRSGSELVLANPAGVFWLVCKDLSGAPSCDTVGHADASLGPVSSLAYDSTNAYIGTQQGLFRSLALGHSVVREQQVDAVPVLSMAYANGKLAVGQAMKAYLFRDGIARYEWTTGVIDAAVTAITFSNDGAEVWYGNKGALNMQDAAGLFHRYGRLNGLPAGFVTALASADTGPAAGIWSASYNASLTYFMPATNKWRYFAGPRWLPPGSVVDVAVLEGDASNALVCVATDTGLALLRVYESTLADKAVAWEAIVHPRHDRFGLVSNVGLKQFGRVESYVQESSDNDGLWTSMYLASLVMRYGATKDKQARDLAWRHFEALEFLNNVTGIKGLMARSVLKEGSPIPGGTWHNSTTMPGWIWKGDTSSDEVCGHMFVYPLMHDIVASTAEEKLRIRTLYLSIIDYIMKNNWTLVDVTGKPTTWGVWDPETLNKNFKYYDERGLNSLQILSWLTQAYAFTNDRKYMDAYNELGQKHGYFVNLLNQKITVPDDNNFSDNELAYLPYATFFHALRTLGGQVPNKDYFIKSLQRMWKIVENDHSSLWTVMTAMALGPDAVSDAPWERAVENLYRWPVELIEWPVKNSERLDLMRSPNVDRFGRTGEALQYIPPDEGVFYRWNTSPYTMDGGSGMQECDPGAPLLAYWMGRYANFW